MVGGWSIRKKLYLVLALLLAMVAVLAWSSIHGHYAYRSVVRSINRRVPELPLANNFNSAVGELRVAWHTGVAAAGDATTERYSTRLLNSDRFLKRLEAARDTFDEYRRRLSDGLAPDSDSPIADNRRERETTHAIESTLAEISRLDREAVGEDRRVRLAAEIDRLQTLAARLPTFLHENIEESMEDARVQYRTLIVFGWFTSVTTVVCMFCLILMFYNWVFRPLRVLVKGSRKIAAGQFGYRIHLDTRDEMSELATNMNDMTARFQEIRDDLDRQVAERTQQVVRGEQLASVGFLAAGVAHEINNPLASIAVCAESLQSRLGALVPEDHADRRIVTQYLGMIEKEAFRCKEITEKLLDFSRIGETKRRPTELRELVQDVVAMVETLGKYEGKRIEVVAGPEVFAVVNGREIKQVVLNLITNALDSADDRGTLVIELRTDRNEIDIVFTDDGCGMTDEVRAHLFEPFFTRRRQGQGTGLGLSISYRIIADHHGTIVAHSDGPGKGSQFHVRIPSLAASQENRHQSQAA